MYPCRPILPSKDYHDLTAYVSDQVLASIADYESLSLLSSTLRAAQVVDPDRLPDNVVTLRSEVVLRDLESDEAETYTLVAPKDADIARGRLSVLAPLGAMVLGQQVGSTVRTPCPFGWRSIRIERLTSQPAPPDSRYSDCAPAPPGIAKSRPKRAQPA